MKTLRLVIGNPGVILFAVLYVAGLVVLSQSKDFDITEVLIVLVIFGMIFPLLAWFATRRAVPLPVNARSSPAEIVVLGTYIIALSIYLIAGPQLIDRVLPAAWSDSAHIHFFVNLTRKLVVFVLIPFLIFRVLFGYGWRDYGISVAGLRELAGGHAAAVLILSAAFLLLQYFLGGGAAPVRAGKFSAHQLAIGLPLCFAWLAVEAGLVEEFFFRGLVQSRLSAWFKSDITAVALMSLIFGLAHAPGFIFRHAGEVEGLGANPTALNAVAYAIVILAPSGILFGVIWARTRNLFAAIIVHAAGDLLPNVASFIQIWKI